MNSLDAPKNYQQSTYIKESSENSRIDTIEQKSAEQASSLSQNDIIVTLSDTCKEMQIAKEAVASNPEIRSEKVEKIKQSIIEGKYEINAEQIAEKIVDFILSQTE